MSDSAAEFARKTEAMFTAAKDQIDETCRLFVLHIAAEVVIETWGPNKQAYDTEYIATGRLRAGWSWSTQAKSVASRWVGGPYTVNGEDTLAAIEAEIRSQPIASISFLQNDVAYGWLIATGGGRHATHGPRPWVDIARANMEIHAQHARQEAAARA